jgi:hypothetical protein
MLIGLGLEGANGASRVSQRLAGRRSTPSAAALGMFLAGHAQLLLAQVLRQAGLGEMAAKRGRRLDPAAWWHSCSWCAAIYLVSAAVAALVHVNAQQLGVTVIVVGAAVSIGVVTLLRHRLQRQEVERSAQEARIADAERASQVNQKRFSAAFSHAAVGMAIVGPEGRSACACSRTGREATGVTCQDEEVVP